jgi:hypothetical protein
MYFKDYFHDFLKRTSTVKDLADIYRIDKERPGVKLAKQVMRENMKILQQK